MERGIQEKSTDDRKNANDPGQSIIFQESLALPIWIPEVDVMI